MMFFCKAHENTKIENVAASVRKEKVKYYNLRINLEERNRLKNLSAMKKSAFYADQRVLQQCNCSVEKRQFESDLGEVINCDVLVHPSGWKFHSSHTHILGEKHLQALSTNIKKLLVDSFPSVREEVKDLDESSWLKDDHLDFNQYKLHIPPMLFGLDVMHIQYNDKYNIEISASDAILCWVLKVRFQHQEFCDFG